MGNVAKNLAGNQKNINSYRKSSSYQNVSYRASANKQRPVRPKSK